MPHLPFTEQNPHMDKKDFELSSNFGKRKIPVQETEDISSPPHNYHNP
jgi:hypothetical protein